MSDNTNSKLTVQVAFERIEELNKERVLFETKKSEVETHEKDLKAQKVVTGEDSEGYRVKKELLDTSKKELEEIEKRVQELSFTKSELKPVFDELAKKFEDELRSEQEREFHVEIGPSIDMQTEDGEELKQKQTAGRKAFKQLLEYLYKDVNWTAKTAPGLLVLVRNMEENKLWVRDKEFDNIIKLRSSNVLVLWKSILEDMTGKGFYEARAFLECWANCGKSISDTVREIQKVHENVRITGTQLNTVEDEYIRSVDDLPADEKELTTQEEVNPEV